jgi:BirA family biotin operon repressor/biotin-[acetyl-CoA-carboxylase] ligase
LNLPEDIAEGLARTDSRRGGFGAQARWYPELTSTNDIAAKWAESGAAEGALVIGDAQTAGRGRQGRTWASPAAAGLYLSLVLRPVESSLPLLTIAAGVAVAEGIEAATGLRPTLKWPNDAYVGARKLAGLLAEGAGAAVIMGIGINLMPAAYPPDIAARATSLEGELGRPIERGLLLGEILSSMHARYGELQAGRTPAIIAAWRARAAAMLGRPVRWTSAGRDVAGIAETIDDRGALLVRTATGIERIISGEVQWT